MQMAFETTKCTMIFHQKRCFWRMAKVRYSHVVASREGSKHETNLLGFDFMAKNVREINIFAGFD
jgi:hypothetical protein